MPYCEEVLKFQFLLTINSLDIFQKDHTIIVKNKYLIKTPRSYCDDTYINYSDYNNVIFLKKSDIVIKKIICDIYSNPKIYAKFSKDIIFKTLFKLI